MSEYNINDNTSNAAQADEVSSVERYLVEQVEAERKSLVTTQWVGAIVVLVLFFWLGSIAMRFQNDLSPNTAATIAKGIIVQRVDEVGPEFTNYLKTELPRLISQAPDYFIEQLPGYRASVEDEIEARFRDYATETANQLGNDIDEFLAANQDTFSEMMVAGTDPEQMDALGEELRALFIAYLAEPDETTGESITQKLDEALTALNEIAAKTERLATAADLTPEEVKLRRAIAILTTEVNSPEFAETIPPLGVELEASADNDGAETEDEEVAGDGATVSANPVEIVTALND